MLAAMLSRAERMLSVAKKMVGLEAKGRKRGEGAEEADRKS